jgi:hypothetical protein
MAGQILQQFQIFGQPVDLKHPTILPASSIVSVEDLARASERIEDPWRV